MHPNAAIDHIEVQPPGLLELVILAQQIRKDPEHVGATPLPEKG